MIDMMLIILSVYIICVYYTYDITILLKIFVGSGVLSRAQHGTASTNRQTHKPCLSAPESSLVRSTVQPP